MPGRRSRGIWALLAGVCLLALCAGAALGAAQTIQSSPTCCTFTQSNFTMDQGEVATFQNATLSGDSHNVTASDNGPDGKKLFASNTIGQGQTPVVGTQYLTQGKYHFVCTIHPGMESDLIVTANGTLVPRPDIELKVLSRKIDKVVSSRRLKVKVSAESTSDDVALTAKKGAKKLGSKSGIDLPAGSSRIVKVKLSAAGKAALKGLDSAKVKVTGTVPFGAPDAAKRRLR
jgi:plastocyanin